MIPYSENDKRWIALVSILSGVLALVCMIIGLMATQYDAEAFANPVKLLSMPAVNVNQIRWFMLLDMLGYYLLLLPLIFYVQRKLDTQTAWSSFFTSLGLGYVLIGSIGAAALAVIWPEIMEKHSTATASMKPFLESDFLLATNFVVKGMWNYLEVILGGLWWLGVGFFVIEHRGLKLTTLVLGFGCLLDSVGELFQIPVLAEIGLNVYLVLAIVWPIWIGIIMLKNKF